MKIKTLAEILAESEADSASSPDIKSKKPFKSSEPAKPSQHSYQDNPRKTAKTRKHSTHYCEDNSLSDDSNFEIDSVDAHSSTSKNPSKSKKRKKRFHPAANFSPEPSDVPVYQPPEAQSIKQMLAEVKNNVHDDPINSDKHQKEFAESHQADLDNLPSALKAYLRTPEQKQAEIDAIKAITAPLLCSFVKISVKVADMGVLGRSFIVKKLPCPLILTSLSIWRTLN